MDLMGGLVYLVRFCLGSADSDTACWALLSIYVWYIYMLYDVDGVLCYYFVLIDWVFWLCFAVGLLDVWLFNWFD